MPRDADPTLHKLGLFFGDHGGPGTAVPTTDSSPVCPYLEASKQFCSLDGEMCPFIGFDYHRCKKYIINLSRGVIPKGIKAPEGKGLQADNTPKAAYKQAPSVTGGPRSNRNEEILEAVFEDLEALTEQGNPKLELSDKGDVADALAAETAKLIKDFGLEDLDPDNLTTKDQQVIYPALAATAVVNIYKDYKLTPKAEKALLTQKVVRQDIGAYLSQYWKISAPGGSRSAALRELSAFYQQAIDAQGGRVHTNYKWLKDLIDSGFESGQELNVSKEGNLEPELPPSAAREALTRLTQASRKAKAKGVKGRGSRRRIKLKITPTGKVQKDDKKDDATKPRSDERVMSERQFKAWFNGRMHKIDPAIRNKLLKDNTAYDTPEEFFEYIETLEKTNSQRAIKKLYDELEKKFAAYFDASQHHDQVLAQWDANVRAAKATGMVTDADLKFLRNDPKQLGKTADAMNGVMRKLIRYDLDMKTLPGGLKIAVPVRKSLLPTFTKTDYEVRRMSEQAGLLAIQKQHRYGQDYGKYNARNLFFKELVAPFVMLFLGIPELIRPITRMWPQGWVDARFFANRSQVPKLSRDDKFIMSQRFASGRAKRVMRGFDKDSPMPTDRAVLHTRTYPTSNKPWSKRRAAHFRREHRKAEKRPRGNQSWRHSFMPR